MNNPPLKKLRELRKKRSLTTTDMAEKLGMSQSMYSYIEIGSKRLSYEVAVAIAEIFETNPDELFYDDYVAFYE